MSVFDDIMGLALRGLVGNFTCLTKTIFNGNVNLKQQSFMEKDFSVKWRKILSKNKSLLNLNPSCPNPGEREKFNLKFLFSHFFVVPQKVL